MDDPKQQSASKSALMSANRVAQWTAAAVVGLGTGLTGAATQIRAEFHKKLLEDPFLSGKEPVKATRKRKTPDDAQNINEGNTTSTRPPKLTADTAEELNRDIEEKQMAAARKALSPDRHAKLEKYEGMLSVHQGNLSTISEKRRLGLLTTKEFVKAMADQKNTFAKEVNNYAKELLGIESDGVRGFLEGTWQRLDTMSENTRNPLTFGALTTATIGAACTMMFFNSMHTRTNLEQLNDKLDMLGDKSNSR